MSDEHNTPDNSAVSKPRRTRRPAAPKATDTGTAPEQAATKASAAPKAATPKTSAETAPSPKATAEKAPATASTAKPSRARTPRKSAATAQASTAETGTGTSLANAAQTSAPAQKPAPDAQKSDARPARTPRPTRATDPASKPAPAPKTADTAAAPATKEASKGTVATGMDAKKPRNTRTARKPAAVKAATDTSATGTSATDNSGGPASPASFTSPPATTAATPQISSTSETPPASVSPSAPADRSGLSRARSADSVSPAAPAANVEGEDRPARPRGRSRNTRSTARPTGTTDAAGTAGTGRTQAPPATAAVAGTTATGRTPAGAAAAAAVAGTGRTAPAQPAPEDTPFERRPHRDAPAHAAPRDSQAEGTADAGLATAATDSSASPASKVEGETLSAEGEAQPTRKNRRGRRGGRGRSRKSRQTGQGTELSADQEADQDAEGTASPLTARPHAKTTHISGDASHTDFDDSEDDDSQTRYMGDARDDVYDDNDDGDDEAFIKANSETPARGRTAKKESTRRGAKVKEKEKEKDVELDSKPGRRKMFISVVPGEQVEVALVEEGVIGEYYLDMLNQAKTKGNIYKGVVHNVDANLQAAFVSYGAHKNGFLQIDEIHSEYYLAHHETAKGKKFPPIQKVIKPGQEVLVQVVKEPTGNKGAFLTTWLSLAGRFLVLTPGQEQIGVSRKVDNDEERARLREMMNGIEPGEGLGVIVRTVSAGTSKTTLKNDLQYLKRVWKEIRRRGTSEVAPSLVYQESSLAERAVRDYLTEDVCEVWVDNETVADSLRETVALLFPRKEDLVRVHVDVRQTLWERFNIQRQLEQIYSREVTLPSGGRLVFDQTEALMAIDINSGKISGKANFESMALKTNIEAAEAIARHLRLRDIGGQIVIDFIEMRDKSHVREVEKTLRNAMKNDRARHDVARMSSFGLLEIVRQRTGSSALAVTMEPCPCCQGTGIRRNMEWQSLQALRQIGRQARTPGTTRCVFESNAELGMYLLNHKRDRLREMEQQLNIPIEIRILA